MPNKNQHTINQLKLDIQVENQEQGFLVRNQLSSYWQEWLVDKMSTVFDELSSEKIIKIEKLELDLGNIDYNNFEEEIKAKFQQIIAVEVNKKLNNTNEEVNIVEPEISDLMLFENFIKTGQFSWTENGQTINIDELFDQIFKRNPDGLRAVFEKYLKIKNYRKRIIYQIDNHLLISILIELFDVKNATSIIENLLIKIKDFDETIEIDFTNKQKLIIEAIAIEVNHKNLVSSELENKINLHILQILEQNFVIIIPLKLLEIQLENKMKEAEFEAEFSENLKINFPENIPEKIYTSHAGLVLLAAYFPTLFKNIGLIKGTEFINIEAKYKAVHLLNYLITGQTSPPENELSFEKILCGIDLFEPVPKHIYLTETEIEKANELLKAVLHNWNALKNTSIAGFRSSFLQREGIIYDETSSWKLRVEKKAYDILLGQLPWGYAFIKFSWTTKPIETEW